MQHGTQKTARTEDLTLNSISSSPINRDSSWRFFFFFRCSYSFLLFLTTSNIIASNSHHMHISVESDSLSSSARAYRNRVSILCMLYRQKNFFFFLCCTCVEEGEWCAAYNCKFCSDLRGSHMIVKFWLLFCVYLRSLSWIEDGNGI